MKHIILIVFAFFLPFLCTAQDERVVNGFVCGENGGPVIGAIVSPIGVNTFTTTDKDGKASVSNLYLGNYYVKEIKASTGYLLDPTEYDLAYNYAGDLTANISKRKSPK